MGRTPSAVRDSQSQCNAMRKFMCRARCGLHAVPTAVRVLQVHSWTADQAFRPRITAKARLRRAHTIAELHDGGMSRRERALVRPVQAEDSVILPHVPRASGNSVPTGPGAAL